MAAGSSKSLALRRTLTIFYLVSCTPFIFAQTAPQQAPATKGVSRSTKGAKAEPAAPKLTPEQERGLRLLKAAESEAAGLAPDMHAFVLWRVSSTYSKIDSKKSDKVAADAFVATQGIEDPTGENSCGPVGSMGDIKSWIQEQVLTKMVEQQRITEVEQLLPQATEPVRNTITKKLVQHYTKEKDFTRAEALLSRLTEGEGYPFDAAADLLLSMGPEMSADRMTIFTQAISYFEQNKPKQVFGSGDAGDFVDRTWSKVPSAMALEAINKLLDQARSSGEKRHYSMTGAGGSVMFASDYEMRLFQLLPALQELDKDKADELLQDAAETKARLAKYPKGMQSVSEQGSFYSYGVTDSDAPHATDVAARDQVAAQISERLNHIRDEAGSHPEQALSEALGLPPTDGAGASPRASALEEVAQASIKKNPRIARSAIDELWKTQEQWSAQQSWTLANLPDLYLKLGDEDGAKKALGAMLKAAEKLYQHDLDADDPNKAFKGTWPSSDLWRKCVQIAAKISPAFAEQIISELPDPDIAAAQRVAFAGSLLGAPGGMNITSDCRKNGSGFSTSVSD